MATLEQMFSGLDRSTLRTILENNDYHLERTIDQCLTISSPSVKSTVRTGGSTPVRTGGSTPLRIGGSTPVRTGGFQTDYFPIAGRPKRDPDFNDTNKFTEKSSGDLRKEQLAEKKQAAHDADADYALAIKLQEEEEVKSPAPAPAPTSSTLEPSSGLFNWLLPSQKNQTAEPKHQDNNICPNCNRACTGSYLVTQGRRYHQGCFKCQGICYNFLYSCFALFSSAPVLFCSFLFLSILLC